jgi:tetratricopeptide (TPR) repeat protein
MTRVSVLMTNYNYERFVEQAVESVLAQTVPPDEIILVDDGSTDGSRERIEALAQRHPDVLRPVFQENQGQAAGFNTAFAHSTGDVLFFLDSDDTWYPEKIETMLPHLQEVGFVQHNMSMLGGRYRSFLVQDEHLRYMQNFGYLDFFVPTSGLGFRREVLEKVLPLSHVEALRICADTVVTRLALHYSALRTVDTPLGDYRVHGGNGFYSRRFQAQDQVMELFHTLNRCLEERGLPRIPLERNCLLPRPAGRAVQDVETTLAALRDMQQEPRHRVPCLVLEGYLLLSQERHEEALAAFGRAAEGGGSLPEDVRMILQMKDGGGLPEGAVNTLSPEVTANTFFQMAVCLVRLRRYEQALAAFAAVLHHAPDRLEIHLNRSDSLRYLGRYEEALAEVDLAEAKNPRLPGLANTRQKVFKAMREAGVDGAAERQKESQGMNVQIQTTSVCNGKCIMCPYLDSWHKANPGVMSDEVFERILETLRGVDVGKLCMYLENEPLADPALLDRTERVIREIPFRLLEISTNAALLTEARAERLAGLLEKVPHQIWISFHGMDKRTYEGIMGLDFEQTLGRIMHFLRLAGDKGMDVVVRGSGEPVHESLRHEFSFTEAQYRAFWQEQFAKNNLARPPRVSYFRYHDRSGTIRRNNIRLQGNVRDSLQGFYCPRVDSWLHFLYTGEMCICCMDYHREQIFGDIRRNSLPEILNGEAYKNMRDMAFGLKPSPSNFICKRCISPNG